MPERKILFADFCELMELLNGSSYNGTIKGTVGWLPL